MVPFSGSVQKKKITYEELFQCKNTYVLTTVPWMCTYEECAHIRNKYIVKRNKFIVKLIIYVLTTMLINSVMSYINCYDHHTTIILFDRLIKLRN